jgi:hypothetical protein
MTYKVREQPNPETQAVVTEQWIRLLLGYARHRGLFMLRVEDAETAGRGGEWDEVLVNERINRNVLSLNGGGNDNLICVLQVGFRRHI